MTTITVPRVEFIRIPKREAQQRFAKGLPIYLCPCKMWPGSPWNVAYLCSCSKEWREAAERFRPVPNRPTSAVWKGDVDKTAWTMMLNQWEWANSLCWETGYYAHYYVEKGWER